MWLCPSLWRKKKFRIIPWTRTWTHTPKHFIIWQKFWNSKYNYPPNKCMKCMHQWEMGIFNFLINLPNGRKNSNTRWNTIKKLWGHQLRPNYRNLISWRMNSNKYSRPLWSKKLMLIQAISKELKSNLKN